MNNLPKTGKTGTQKSVHPGQRENGRRNNN